MRKEFPRNLRYSPLNWLIVNWGFNGSAFPDCGLPEPLPCVEPKEGKAPECVPLPIREAIDTYDWERFLPEIMVGIEEPDEDIAANYAREAAIDFAKRARVLQREILIPIQPEECTYPLEPYDDEHIIGVIGVSMDNKPACYCSDGCKVRLPNGIQFTADIARGEVRLESDVRGRCCDKPQLLRILVWAAPTEDSCAYDAFLYNNFRREITNLARRNYILALHFRDRDLLRVLPDLAVYERDVMLGKKKAMTPHSIQVNNSGSGMWGYNGPRRRLF